MCFNSGIFQPKGLPATSGKVEIGLPKITQTLNAGDNTVNFTDSGEVVGVMVKESGGQTRNINYWNQSVIPGTSININLGAGSIANAEIYITIKI